MKQETKTTIIDAMNAHFDAIARKQQPQDTSTRKDELKITPGEWEYSNVNNSDYYDIEGESRVCSVEITEQYGKDEAEANAKAICTAVNETYGKGYNPAVLEQLIEAAEWLLEGVDAGETLKGPKIMHAIAEFTVALKTAKI